MSVYLVLPVLAIMTYLAINTGSFGIWTWKHGNKLGSIMIFVLILIALGLPITVYSLNK